jgi:hypothetical protein
MDAFMHMCILKQPIAGALVEAASATACQQGLLNGSEKMVVVPKPNKRAELLPPKNHIVKHFLQNALATLEKL